MGPSTDEGKGPGTGLARSRSRSWFLAPSVLPLKPLQLAALPSISTFPALSLVQFTFVLSVRLCSSFPTVAFLSSPSGLGTGLWDSGSKGGTLGNPAFAPLEFSILLLPWDSGERCTPTPEPCPASCQIRSGTQTPPPVSTFTLPSFHCAQCSIPQTFPPALPKHHSESSLSIVPGRILLRDIDPFFHFSPNLGFYRHPSKRGRRSSITLSHSTRSFNQH